MRGRSASSAERLTLESTFLPRAKSTILPITQLPRGSTLEAQVKNEKPKGKMTDNNNVKACRSLEPVPGLIFGLSPVLLYFTFWFLHSCSSRVTRGRVTPTGRLGRGTRGRVTPTGRTFLRRVTRGRVTPTGNFCADFYQNSPNLTYAGLDRRGTIIPRQGGNPCLMVYLRMQGGDADERKPRRACTCHGKREQP